MKQFIHLTPKESIGLDKAIYKNALQLKNDALLIASKRQSYGSAISLLILSSEEVIKSVLVRLHAEKLNIYKLSEASKFFYQHKIRHQIAQLIEMGSGLIESMVKYEEQKPTKLLNTKSKRFNNLVNGFIDIVNATRPFLEATDRISELQAFDALKNKGFYVDYKDELILPQTGMTEAIYNRTLLITERVFRFSKLIRILHHTKLENHMTKKEIEKNKEILKDFINKGLDGFSFKELNRKFR